MSDTRPALAAVLSALTGHAGPPLANSGWDGLDVSMTHDRVGASLRVRDVVVPYGTHPWRVDDTVSALEILTERSLWPWQPGDPTAPRWWCESAPWEVESADAVQRPGIYRVTVRFGEGDAASEEFDASSSYSTAQWAPHAIGKDVASALITQGRATPPSILDLVTVASLGATTLARIASLVDALCATTTQRWPCSACQGAGTLPLPAPGRGSFAVSSKRGPCKACRGNGGAVRRAVNGPVVWRVMTREAVKDAVQSNLRGGDEALPDGSYEPRGIAHAWAVENALIELRRAGSQAFRTAWPEVCPWTQPDLRGAWPMLRTLALDCGVHLLDADARRVVIGVEAL